MSNVYEINLHYLQFLLGKSVPKRKNSNFWVNSGGSSQIHCQMVSIKSYGHTIIVVRIVKESKFQQHMKLDLEIPI